MSGPQRRWRNLVTHAAQLSRDLEADLGHPNTCDAVAQLLDDHTGGDAAFTIGEHVDDAGRRRGHAWNTLPDGTILDATANQFGGDRVLLIPLWDHRQQRYRHGHSYRPGEPLPNRSRANPFFRPEHLAGWDDDQPRYGPLPLHRPDPPAR